MDLQRRLDEANITSQALPMRVKELENGATTMRDLLEATKYALEVQSQEAIHHETEARIKQVSELRNEWDKQASETPFFDAKSPRSGGLTKGVDDPLDAEFEAQNEERLTLKEVRSLVVRTRSEVESMRRSHLEEMSQLKAPCCSL